MPLVIILVAGLVALLGLVRRKDREGRARWMHREGGVLMGIFSVFLLLFVTGEGVTDPGGFRAAVWIGLWAVVLAGVGVLIWKRPRWAMRTLAVLTALAVAEELWLASGISGRATDEIVTAAAGFFVVFPIAVLVLDGLLGWKRPAAGGVMLLVLTVAASGFVISAVEGDIGRALMGFGFIAAVPLASGVLYLVASRLARGEPGAGSAPAAAG